MALLAWTLVLWVRASEQPGDWPYTKASEDLGTGSCALSLQWLHLVFNRCQVSGFASIAKDPSFSILLIFFFFFNFV